MTKEKIQHDIEQDIIHEEQLDMAYGWQFLIEDENGNQRVKSISIPSYKEAIEQLWNDYPNVRIVSYRNW
jgi:hypothetical protein